MIGSSNTTRAAWASGQLILQPTFAKSDKQFSSIDLVRSTSVVDDDDDNDYDNDDDDDDDNDNNNNNNNTSDNDDVDDDDVTAANKKNEYKNGSDCEKYTGIVFME